MLAVFFICQRHHITYHFQLRRPPADAKSCAFIKTVPNPSEKQASYIVEGNAESRRALRQHNREQIKQHPEWFPAPLKVSDRRWQALAENNHFLSSDHLHNITEVAIHRLEQQLGKPYVWGGTRPDQGFDCSGLVFMPTTRSLRRNSHARLMRCITIAGQPLWRITTCAGEICYFPYPQPRDCRPYGGVSGRWPVYRVAAHRGNHSGKPVSRTFLAGPFLGARRILTEETIL